MNDFDYRLTTRVSGAAVSRPLDPLVMRFINKEELMTGNEDLTVQFYKILRMDQMKQLLKVKCNVCGKKHRRKSFCRRCDEIDCPCGYCPKRLGKCSACGGFMSEA